MKIAIIGGTGLIGSNLAKVLESENHEVYIFSRQKFLPPNMHPQNNIHLITSPEPLAKDLDGIEVLINLAGESIMGERWTDEYKQSLRFSRINFTRKIVSALEKCKSKPKVFIQGSAIGFYGIQEAGIPIFSENANKGNDFLAELCADWEMEALKAQDFGIRTILLRTGVVLSPQGGALQKMLLPFQLFVGGPIGNGNQYMSWIHISDMVHGIKFLMENQIAQGPFNLTSPNSCSNEEFCTTLGKILKRPSFMRVPSLALFTLYGEGADIILKGQNVVPTKLLEMNYPFKFTDLKQALENLLGKD